MIVFVADRRKCGKRADYSSMPGCDAGGPVNVPDMKIIFAPKELVLTRMEELIHHFINVTQG